jgi:hypothetical protein
MEVEIIMDQEEGFKTTRDVAEGLQRKLEGESCRCRIFIPDRS